MPLSYDSLPTQLLALLQAGHAVTVRWDCGSDESFVYTQLDGVEQPFNLGENYYDYLTFRSAEYEAYLTRITNLAVLLDGFLTERLGLPSVGEFHMQGGGHILLESNCIIIEFQSDATCWDDLPTPADWTPQFFLSTEEVAEMLPEWLSAAVGAPGPAQPHPDPALAAAYTGREVLFTL